MTSDRPSEKLAALIEAFGFVAKTDLMVG